MEGASRTDACLERSSTRQQRPQLSKNQGRCHIATPTPPLATQVIAVKLPYRGVGVAIAVAEAAIWQGLASATPKFV
jgi:hypothetical protein